MAERTAWELLVHLHLNGWTHEVLPHRAKKSARLRMVPLRPGDTPTKVWWTRESHGPSHAYLLCLATASEIFTKIDLLSSIKHLQPLIYYQQLLQGMVPGQGAHVELVEGEPVHLAFEGEAVLEDEGGASSAMVGRGRGQRLGCRRLADSRGRRRSRGRLALGGGPRGERAGSGRGRSRGSGGRGHPGRGASSAGGIGGSAEAGPPPLVGSRPQEPAQRSAPHGDDDSLGRDDRPRKRQRRQRREGHRQRNPLSSKWMQCPFVVTQRQNEDFLALEITCPFHSSIKQPAAAEAKSNFQKIRCTRSRVIRPRPGETDSEALERVKASGRCWLIKAKDATSRREHMAMKDVADQDALGDKTAQMRSVWDFFGGLPDSESGASSSASAGAACSSPAPSTSGSGSASGSGSDSSSSTSD